MTLSTYEKAKRPEKKTDNSSCSSFEVSELLAPQQPTLEHGNFSYNFCDLPLTDPTPVATERRALIGQLGTSGGGKALDSKTRNRMENDFGCNLGSVRVHTDSYATNLTGALNAKATCYGQDIYFGKNQYSPNTQEGTNLLKHELNHYQQQTQTGTKLIQNQLQSDETADTVNVANTVNVNAERDVFAKTLGEQFGFDDITIGIMMKVYDKIRITHPNSPERDIGWQFFRAMSKFDYSNSIFSLNWNALAGSLGKETSWSTEKTVRKENRNYFLNLGLTDTEYNRLSGMIALQHAIVSDPKKYDPMTVSQDPDLNESIEKMGRRLDLSGPRCREVYEEPEEYEDDDMCDEHYGLSYTGFHVLYFEYWNRFHGKGDFAHMAFVIAAHLVDEKEKGVLEKYAPLTCGTVWAGHEGRKDIAGSGGDTTVPGDWRISKCRGWGETAVGPDDYIADLDGVNIAKRISGGASIMQAMNSYYGDLEKNDVARVTHFLINVPDSFLSAETMETIRIDYPDIYRDILNTRYKNIEETILRKAGVKNMGELKDKWPDSWNFLINLQNRNHTMIDYRASKP